MLISPGRDLRQVRDHEHLVPLRHLGKRRADARADLSADSLIDLVEHQRRHGVMPSQHDLEREHEPGELAARRDPREWPRVEAHVELHQELHALGPG